MTDGELGKRKPIVHPKPLLATVRRLYGTAFRCGKPGCERPLYKLNNETGEIILNSHISHICARSEGGPRWDPKMTAKENRSEANLLPMCLEHASEIDVTPDSFPVELLHEWKRAQIAEHFEMQKGWPLTDDEAQGVIDASFDPAGYGVAIAAASSVTAAARAVGLLAATAREQRRLPWEAASGWHAMRARVQQSMPVAWSAETGELLPLGEPSALETEPFKARLEACLQEVTDALRPLVVTLVGELHAVRAVAPHLAPWCDWVEASAGDVVAAAGRWPGRPPEDDDDLLSERLAELLRASSALGSAWQGQPADQPPPPSLAATEPAETAADQHAREHSDLLDSARPWARVESRPYDAALYARLVQAASYAIEIPELPMYLPVNLRTTMGLAAAVARNAGDDTFATLIDEAADLRPIAVSVTLVLELMFTAQQAERSELEAKAKACADRLLRETDWTDRRTWVDNRFQARYLLNLTASITSDDEVRERVATAVTGQPDMLEPILIAVSEQAELRDIHDWSQLRGIDTHLVRPPAWLPTADIASLIRRQYPDLQSSQVHEDQGTDGLFRKLAKQLLEAESRSKKS